MTWFIVIFFFFQAEDGIRDFCLSRGLGDVYKRQISVIVPAIKAIIPVTVSSLALLALVRVLR